MKRDSSGQLLSAVFVDYDNIYLSLKRKSEDAAKRFAKDAGLWLREIESGALITPTNAPAADRSRRLVMNRCYGNPVPRRNTADGSTDMSSFPFVRHHFLRSGFEVIDCPPLTQQLKNSSDIRMVMDVRDFLTHDTYFDEFIVLSGDADFTPLLHRLRAHARRTVIFANDYTVAPYTAICDGEVREADLIALLTSQRSTGELARPDQARPEKAQIADGARNDQIRREIMSEIILAVRSAPNPVPLEALADRLIRTLGHERTVATAWAGAGGFRELLIQSLPEDIRISEQPPYVCYEPARHVISEARPVAAPRVGPAAGVGAASAAIARPPQAQSAMQAAPLAAAPVPQLAARAPIVQRPPQRVMAEPAPVAAPQPAPRQSASAVQQSIARIHEACQAPPLAPPEYRMLFEIMSQEITDNGLAGAQTVSSIVTRAQGQGLEIGRDDVRFILDVVSEADPWFEQGTSPTLFAGRFRNFVVARCRSQGLVLSAEEIDLVDAWFATGGALARAPAASEARGERWATAAEGQRAAAPAAQNPPMGEPAARSDAAQAEEFPRILRARMR